MARQASAPAKTEPVRPDAEVSVSVAGALGPRIRRERQAAGLTVRKLAARIDV